MYNDVPITARTMAEALSKVKNQFGSDALIVQQEENNGQVTIIVRSHASISTQPTAVEKTESTTQHNDLIESSSYKKSPQIPIWAQPLNRFNHDDVKSSSIDNTSHQPKNAHTRQKDNRDIKTAPQLDIPVRTDTLNNVLQVQSDHNTKDHQTENTQHLDHSSHENPKTLDYFNEPIEAIGTLCDLATYHQLGEEISEAWLLGMNNEFSKKPIKLSNSLENLINHDTLWLRKLSAKQRLIFVGPPGSGKTVTLAKVAAYLLARGKAIKVVTLDVVKSIGVKQLESYLSPLGINVEVGHKSVVQKLDQEIMLIDTAGLNIHNNHDFTYLQSLHQKFKIPFILVLPSDTNPLEVDELCQLYRNVGTENIICTKLDLTKRYGAVLRSAHKGLKLLMLSNSPNLSEKLMIPKIETIVHNMIKACEVK